MFSAAERLFKALGAQKILSETHKVRRGVSGLMFALLSTNIIWVQSFLAITLCFTFRMGIFTLQFCNGIMSFDFVLWCSQLRHLPPVLEKSLDFGLLNSVWTVEDWGVLEMD